MSSLAQVKSRIFTYWEQWDWHLDTFIQKDTTIFDVHSFVLEDTSNTFEYYPIAECYLFPPYLGTYRINFEDSTLLINYHRNRFDSTLNRFIQVSLSDTYRFDLKIADKGTPLSEDDRLLFGHRSKRIRKIDMELVLTSMRNAHQSRYYCYYLVQNSALKRWRKFDKRHYKRFLKKKAKEKLS